jgi:hypothetical protein
MQGISTAKHQHLVDALLQLENLLSGDYRQDSDRQLALELKTELEAMHASYQQQVKELSELIMAYQDLFHRAKMQFLSPKLKALRKQSEHDARIMPLLTRNIQLVYGT